jgi:hypothetical protein
MNFDFYFNEEGDCLLYEKENRILSSDHSNPKRELKERKNILSKIFNP